MGHKGRGFRWHPWTLWVPLAPAGPWYQSKLLCSELTWHSDTLGDTLVMPATLLEPFLDEPQATICSWQLPELTYAGGTMAGIIGLEGSSGPSNASFRGVFAYSNVGLPILNGTGILSFDLGNIDPRFWEFDAHQIDWDNPATAAFFNDLRGGGAYAGFCTG